jgi:hypothetical protein
MEDAVHYSAGIYKVEGSAPISVVFPTPLSSRADRPVYVLGEAWGRGVDPSTLYRARIVEKGGGTHKRLPAAKDQHFETATDKFADLAEERPRQIQVLHTVSRRAPPCSCARGSETNTLVSCGSIFATGAARRFETNIGTSCLKKVTRVGQALQGSIHTASSQNPSG